MLKWAVNGTNRQAISNYSGEHLGNEIFQNPKTTTARQRRSINSIIDHPQTNNNRKQNLRRRSSGHDSRTNLRRKALSRDKENNHLTSTPFSVLPTTSPLRKLDSLKDLSNITQISLTPTRTPRNIKLFDTTIVNSTNSKNNPSQYATTLPTFDLEYSPCAIVPGPILALRGIGIADSYFEKPRYLNDDKRFCQQKNSEPNHIENSVTPISSQFSDLAFPSEKRSNLLLPNTIQTHQNGEDSLSSSRMGDLTLDRMIDAILESARKEKRPTKSKHTTCPIMSPTYTPAEDPASDLNEFWDPSAAKYFQSDNRDTVQFSNSIFNEREVRTPDYYDPFRKNNEKDTIPNTDNIETTACHLRRQRGVRRKHKKNTLKSNIKCTAQKFFSINPLLRRSIDELAKLDTPKGYPSLSPQSGSNSVNDFDNSTDKTLNYTKRKLLFSPAKLKNVEVS